MEADLHLSLQRWENLIILVQQWQKMIQDDDISQLVKRCVG